MIIKIAKKGKRINARARAAMDELSQDSGRESRLMMIQMLIPLGPRAVGDELQAEVRELTGERYARGKRAKRWGQNPGSVYLGDQKVSVSVPRVRDTVMGQEVPLRSYAGLQNPHIIDDVVFSRVINGIAQGKYEKAVIDVPETFGIKKSSICRRFIRASARKLRQFLERDLSEQDIVAIFMDGKTFAENEIVIALGVTMEGDKVLLGFIEAVTENHIICRDFLNNLRDRGLRTENEILFIIDGGKGLYKGIKAVFGDKALIQRCQWHKRENVVNYFAENKEGVFSAQASIRL